MLGRRRIDTPDPIRSSLADAAFAVEERVVWGGADVLRRLAEVVKWPFERIAWAIERGLVWPLEERTDGWSASVRIAGATALALLAAGAGVAGLVIASGGDGGGNSGGTVVRATPATSAPPAAAATNVAPKAAAPVLQGAKPDFAAEADGGVAKGAAESPAAEATTGSATTAGSTAEVARSAPSSGKGSTAAADEKVAGPAAIKVARRFAGAFVLYEIGHESANVHNVFKETATPQLTHALLQRPPRQPAGTEVPKAKVLNFVPGPNHGDTYTLSVSLLRVGVTSELRLDMQRNEKTGKWQVTDALG